jgi:hypothetical protein
MSYLLQVGDCHHTMMDYGTATTTIITTGL